MVGDGRYKTTLINLVKNNQLNKYYSFHKHQKLSNLKNFYKKANICFISLKEGNVLNSTIPAKLQTYMSMGMPIIGSISGETSDVIRESKCGLVSSPGNKLKLFKNIKKILGMNISQLKMMGENGNKYSYNNFNKKIILNKLIFSLN